METTTVDSIAIIFHPDERNTADLISSTCNRALQLAQDWGLESPEDCRIYVMTSWSEFVFQSAPWSWRILLATTLPFWVPRIRRTWPYSAGWTQRYGKRIAIGVKPPRLIEQSAKSSNVRMFVEEMDKRVNVQHVTCHELIHACSAHLRLPVWLNEGIATVAVDRFLAKQTVLNETLDLLERHTPKAPPPSYREMSHMGLEAIVYHGTRGYWLVRYLEETHPGFLKRMLAQEGVAQSIERETATELQMDPARFWAEIDDRLVHHFGGKG